MKIWQSNFGDTLKFFLMKAIVIAKPGGPEVLEWKERPTPFPKPDEVLIRVKAAGVNRPDVFQRKGNYPPPPGAPADIPGMELAGIIEQCGPEVQRWKPGDAVCALVSGGAYAEFVTAPAGQCLSIPRGWDFVSSASLPETVFTVWHNVFQRGALKAGEHFLVHGGSSGIGVTAIQLAKLFGAKVFATAGSEKKCRDCESLGADRCVNYHESDFEESFILEGMDLILDMIGGDYTPKNINLLREDGRLVIINSMKGSKAELDLRAVMQKRLTITGSTLRGRSGEFKATLAAEIEKKLWPLLESGQFRPVIYRQFPMVNADQAHALMESSEHTGKIILVNE